VAGQITIHKPTTVGLAESNANPLLGAPAGKLLITYSPVLLPCIALKLLLWD